MEVRVTDPGSMRHRVDVQDNQPVRSAGGAPVDNWVTWAASINVKIEPGRSREFFAAKQTQAEITHEVTMRWLPGLKSRMRLKYISADGTRYLYFGSIVNVDEAGQWVKMICREAV
jgi:SPP1 family predicted phage head-tail adaptor